MRAVSGTSTPDLSFDNLKGIGNLSGVARKFMLMDATIEASENMETFGPVVQRCVSVVLDRNMQYYQTSSIVPSW